jgi:hypothetical protein
VTANNYNVSEFVVYSGLLPTEFNNPVGALSFTSSKTASHNSPPGTFSTLEGMPHNHRIWVGGRALALMRCRF